MKMRWSYFAWAILGWLMLIALFTARSIVLAEVRGPAKPLHVEIFLGALISISLGLTCAIGAAIGVLSTSRSYRPRPGIWATVIAACIVLFVFDAVRRGDLAGLTFSSGGLRQVFSGWLSRVHIYVTFGGYAAITVLAVRMAERLEMQEAEHLELNAEVSRLRSDALGLALDLREVTQVFKEITDLIDDDPDMANVRLTDFSDRLRSRLARDGKNNQSV